MNKKYMDFVPKKGGEPGVSRVVAVKTATEVRTATIVKTRPERPARPTSASDVKISDVPTVRKSKVANFQPKFVRTEVEKRPLSKNVYQKKVVVPKEEKPSKPVTIIHKPEKDSKVGLIVTIIITIILGAAAGTVAFLLLPK